MSLSIRYVIENIKINLLGSHNSNFGYFSLFLTHFIM